MTASTMCIAAIFAILAVGHSAQAEPTTGARKLLQMSPMMMGMSGSPMMMSSMSPSPMMMMSPSPSMMMSSTSKPMMYMLKLTPSMEVPATNAMSSAMCNLTFMSDSIMYVLNVTNLMSPTAAHIHAGYMGANGPVVAFLYTVPAMSPMSMMSPGMMGMSSNMMTKNGVLAKGTLYSSSFVGPAKGMSVMDFYNKYIATGDAYVNVHTTKNPDGEIRAQIDSSSMVKSA